MTNLDKLCIIADKLDQVLLGVEKRDISIKGGVFDGKCLERTLSNITYEIELLIWELEQNNPNKPFLGESENS